MDNSKGLDRVQTIPIKSPDVLYTEVGKVMADGNPKEAIGALEMFLAIWPDYGLAHNDLGVLYFNEGEKEKALGHYEQAARLETENTTFQKNLADFYYVEAGRVEEAMGLYIKVLAANPLDTELLLILGGICASLEKTDNAKFFYGRVLELEPWHVEARQKFEELGKGEDGGRGTEVGGRRSEVGGKEYLVSAIVSTYNSERFIRGCLEDLEAQTIADQVEIIVINSGSEQNEEAVVKEFQQRYENIKYIETDSRETVYEAWNLGIKASTGKYLTNANTDDRHRKDAFEVMVKVLEALPEVALGYADLIITEVENETFENCTPAGLFRWMNWNRKDLLKGVCFMGPQPMWRRSVHEEYGYFDGSLVTSGDYEFWLRISQTQTFLHIPVLLGVYLRSPGSIEHANRKRQAKENREIVQTYKSAYESKKIIKRRKIDATRRNLETAKYTHPLDHQRPMAPLLETPCQKDLTSIIIIVSDHQTRIKECLNLIERHTPDPSEIIFVDKSGGSPTSKWIKEESKRKERCQLITVSKESGLSQCANKGISVSSGEYILLLHDHVRVADGWLSGMLEYVKSADDVGIVGPMTNRKTAGVQYVPGSKHVGIDPFIEYAEAFRERNRHRRIPSRELADDCMLFRRRLVQHIGLFDEALQQGSESADYCLRAALAGYHNVIAGDVFVQCEDPSLKTNKNSFTYKWSGIDLKSHDGKRLAVLNAVEAAEDFYHKDEIDKAVRALIDALKYSPHEISIYHRLAQMLIDCKRFQEALEAIKAIPKKNREHPKTLELAGYCKEGMDLDDEAEPLADRALSLNPSCAAALNLKGVLAYKRGDKDACRAFLDRAMVADPGYGDAYTNMGILDWGAEHQEDALKFLEKGCRLSPAVSDHIEAYLSVISDMSEFAKAEEIFREAKALYPQNRRILWVLIDILFRQEKYESALQEIQGAMTTFGITDDILATAETVLDKLSTRETKEAEKSPKISLCMIVKNEEKCLTKCLMSALPVVDEIIIADTGSTDRTRKIAKAFGARVLNYEWTDDFAAARNASLENAEGEWILVLDADEVISPLDYDPLTKLVKNASEHPLAYTITTRNYVRPVYISGWTCNKGGYPDEEQGTGWYPSRKVRLFSNDRRIRFQNAVHELVEPSLKAIGIHAKECDIPIHHYGQLDKNHYVAKGEEYYLLSKKKLEEKGDDLQALIELATQSGGEFGKYEEAIDLWKRVLKLDAKNKKAFLNMSFNYLRLRRYEASREAAKNAIALDPSLKEAVIAFTTCELLIGDAEKNVLMLEDLLRQFPDYPMALAILGATYGMGHEEEKGFSHIRYLMKMGFACADYLYDLSERLVSLRKADRAASLLEFAVRSGNGTKKVRELMDSLLIG